MSIVNVAIPVLRSRLMLTVDKGRPWSVIEHIILEALTEKAWSAADLSVAGKLPRRVVVESCARLMRAGWAELVQDRDAVRFRATPRGRIVARYDELPTVMERRKRSASYVVDLVTNEVFRGRAWVVHDEKALKARAKTEAFVWIKTPNKEVDYDPNALIELLLDDDETFVDAEPSGPLYRWAVATVKDGVVDGLPPRRDLAELRRAVLTAAANVAAEPTVSDTVFSVARPHAGRIAEVPETQAISFDNSDLILGADAHKSAIKACFTHARSKIFIHSTFIAEDKFLALLPDITSAARRGVRVHVLWGQNEDADGIASTKTAVASLRENEAVASLDPLLVIHPFSTGSHAKLLIADAGERGDYVAIVGSCNWLASGFQSYEASVRLRDPSIVRTITDYLAQMSCMHGGVWSVLASELARISQKLQRPLQSGPPSNAKASVIIGAHHNDFVLRARDEAQTRALVVSHKLGPVSGPSIVTPLIAAVKDRGIKARVLYGRTRKPMSSRAEAELAASAGAAGVALDAVHSPRVHAKVLAWDDDAIAVSSLNWLSADPTEIDSLNEIGVWVQAPCIAKALIDDIDRALVAGAT